MRRTTLHTVEILLRKLIQKNEDEVYFIWDIEGKNLIFISQSYEEVWGRSCLQLYEDSMEWMLAIYEEDKQTIMSRTFTEVLQQDHPVVLEYRIVRLGEEIRWICEKRWRLLNEYGECIAVGSLARDVTSEHENRMRMEESLKIQKKEEQGIADFFLQQGNILDMHISELLQATQKLCKSPLPISDGVEDRLPLRKNILLQQPLRHGVPAPFLKGASNIALSNSEGSKGSGYKAEDRCLMEHSTSYPKDVEIRNIAYKLQHHTSQVETLLNDTLEYFKQSEEPASHSTPFNLPTVLESIDDSLSQFFALNGIRFLIKIAEEMSVSLLGDVEQLKKVLRYLVLALCQSVHVKVLVLNAEGICATDASSLITLTISATYNLFMDTVSKSNTNLSHNECKNGIYYTLAKNITSKFGGTLHYQANESGASFVLSIEFSHQKLKKTTISKNVTSIPEGFQDASRRGPREQRSVLGIHEQRNEDQQHPRILKGNGYIPEGFQDVARRRGGENERVHFSNSGSDIKNGYGTSTVEGESTRQNHHSRKNNEYIAAESLAVLSTSFSSSMRRPQTERVQVSNVDRNCSILDMPADSSTETRHKWSTERQSSVPCIRPLLGDAKPPVARVLIIEDNVINQHLASITFNEIGCLVDIVGDGYQAISLWNNQYDLVFIDIGLPGMDGFEVAQNLRKRAKGLHIPIIGMSSHMCINRDNADFLLGPFDDFICKPFGVASIHNLVDKWLIHSNQVEKSAVG